VRKKVANAILELARDPANKKLLKDVQIEKPVLADYETDYAPLAKLGLEKFVVAE